MIVIYDFDGTLTPYEASQFAIIKECGYDNDEMLRLEKEMHKKNINPYVAHYSLYAEILKKNNKIFNLDNVLLGVKEVEFNKGLIEYFEYFKNSNIKHYLVTSSFKDYVSETVAAKYFEKIYGTEFLYKDDGTLEIKEILDNIKKVDAIKEIVSQNPNEKFIYFGDGLTDGDAFEYIQSIGGKSVFVGKEFENNEVYKLLYKKGLINYTFKYDYSINKDIFNFIKKESESDKNGAVI